MKQFLRLFLCIFISLLLDGCNASTSSNTAPEKSETVATDSEKGKRSNPYSFGEDVTIEVKASDDLTARFIFNFSQAWDSARIKKEYQKYKDLIFHLRMSVTSVWTDWVLLLLLVFSTLSELLRFPDPQFLHSFQCGNNTVLQGYKESWWWCLEGIYHDAW